MSNIDIEIIDFMDLLNFTLSLEFNDRWKSKYGSKLVELFQEKIFTALKEQKRLNSTTIKNFLVRKHQYDANVVMAFYDDIDISLYRPFIV